MVEASLLLLAISALDCPRFAIYPYHQLDVFVVGVFTFCCRVSDILIVCNRYSEAGFIPNQAKSRVWKTKWVSEALFLSVLIQPWLQSCCKTVPVVLYGMPRVRAGQQFDASRPTQALTIRNRMQV
eukprot:3938823-Rhodomonas_salina.3